MSEPKQITRRQLYDLVWSKPMMHLAEEFGITGTGLAKICRRHAVPTPPRGYWAKLQNGKRVTQERFVELNDPQKERVAIYAGAWRVLDAARDIIRSACQRKADREHTTSPPQLAGAPPSAAPELHPLLRQTAQALRKGKADSDGAVHATANGMVGIIAGPASVERAISIADALIRAFIDRGLTVEAVGKGLRVAGGDDEAILTLAERTRREKHIPTPEELAAEERRKKRLERHWASRSWNTPSPGPELYQTAFAEFDTIWTGELVLHADGCGDGVRRTWADGRMQRIDRMIEDITMGIEALLAVCKVQREEREERDRRYRELERRRGLARQRAEREKKREAFLAELMLLQRQVDDLAGWIGAGPLRDTATAGDSNARLWAWASALLEGLQQRVSLDGIRAALDAANLFPEADDLHDPLGEPPQGYYW